jgi:HK97 family phage major capsid protein
MAALQDLLDEQARITAELQRMENDPETTEESDGNLRDTLIARWRALDDQCKPIIARMEEIRSITRTAQDPANREGPAGNDGTSASRFGSPDLVITSNQDPYDCQEMIRHERQILMPRSEIKARALDAVELEAKRGNITHDRAEEATAKAQGNAGIARHMLLYGSQEYQDAFAAYTQDPEHVSEAHRAALTLSSGSVMLPFVLDPTIVLTNAGSANPWRRISNVKQTTSNTWNGVNSAGVNAAWLAEATITTDNTPSLAAITVTPQKAAAWVYGSYELLEDSDFGQQLPVLLADAKDRLEEAAFATGGGGTVPNGVVPGATTVVTTATTTVIALGDVYATQAALPARFRNAPGAAWVANVAIINKIRQLDTAGGSSFWTNLGKGQPETLLGAPIYESTTMTASVATTSLMAIFGDFSQFLIVDRVGVSVIYDPLIQGTGGILPSGQAGWFMFWRVGSQLTTVNAFRVMKGL